MIGIVETATQAPILGARIRQRRRELGISQIELARQIGISPSYMNLIEWNKRPIAGNLLRRIAETLQLTVDQLDGASERRLMEALLELAGQPSLQPLGIEKNHTGEFIGRFPGWARGIAALARSEREATERARTLSDRLSNDPFLGEAVHRMLTRIAAIRSAVEILTDYDDLPADRRERFFQIVREESNVLSDVGQALATYLDKADEADRILTPVDEVEALFDRRDNRFAEIEAAAEPLSVVLSDLHPAARQARARDLVDGRLIPTIETVMAASAELKTSAALARARRALKDYAVGAVLMPMNVFAAQSAALRYDMEALAGAFSADVETVCRRLTALPDGDGIPAFGYLRANAAGTIVEMFGLRGLAVPRYAAACPLWVLYRAQQSPEAVFRQRALFPSGIRFVFVARARHSGPSGFGRPHHYLTDMVTMTEEDSFCTVYAPDPAALVEEVGPSCRLCPRHNCEHRADDPLAG